VFSCCVTVPCFACNFCRRLESCSCLYFSVSLVSLAVRPSPDFVSTALVFQSRGELANQILAPIFFSRAGLVPVVRSAAVFYRTSLPLIVLIHVDAFLLRACAKLVRCLHSCSISAPGHGLSAVAKILFTDFLTEVLLSVLV
jgi:hypothetical protein